MTNSRSGPDDDAGPRLDPTTNVLSLVDAAVRRLDDLRKTENRHARDIREIKENCENEISSLREKLSLAESRRIDAVNLAESRRIDSVTAEQKNSLDLASARAELTASALAERVDTSAKTLASTYESTNRATAATTEARFIPLERARYEQVGGKETRLESRQSNQWIVGAVIGVFFGGIGFILGLASLIVSIIRG